MRKQVDNLTPAELERLQADWKAGLLPARTIAAKYGIDVDGLTRHAMRHQWEASDLTSHMPREVERAVVERTVASHAPAGSLPATNDQELARQFGSIVANVTDEQQRDITKARRFVIRMFKELEELQGPEIDERAIEGLARLVGQDNPDLAKALTSVRDSSSTKERLKDLEVRSHIAGKLAISLEKLVELERKVWGLDKANGGRTLDYDTLLDELQRRDDARTVN